MSQIQTEARHPAALEDLRGLWLVRAFEERVRELRVADEIVGSVHLCIGQEAVAVGACGALDAPDVVFATYRGHGFALARGVPPDLLLAEFLGRETGVNGGRGGSAHFSAPDWGFYGENSIVGAGAPMAVGAALAARFDGSGRVALAVFGDGAMNQGSVHEALNFAAAFRLPVVFLCENNLYTELTPTRDMVANDRFWQRAAGYGIPGCRVDGNDADAVRQAVGAAVEGARRGDGPSLVEAMTQRLVGHYIGDAEVYRRPGELDRARQDEPIARLERSLRSGGTPESSLRAVEAGARHLVSEAAASALAAPLADTTSAQEHLYG